MKPFQETPPHVLAPSDADWLRRYGAGVQTYAAEQLDEARENMAFHLPARAIIACRKALEIPVRELKLSTLLRNNMSSLYQRQRGEGQSAFRFSPLGEIYRTLAIPDIAEFQDIEAQSRRALMRGGAALKWTEIMGHHNNHGAYHEAAIAAGELVLARADGEHRPELLNNYQRFAVRIAIDALHHHLEALPDPLKTPERAGEADEAALRLLRSLARLTTHYTVANVPVADLARNELITTTYELDDLNATLSRRFDPSIEHYETLYDPATIQTLLIQAYAILARSSRLGERRFFEHESAAVGTPDRDVRVNKRPGPRVQRPKRHRWDDEA